MKAKYNFLIHLKLVLLLSFLTLNCSKKEEGRDNVQNEEETEVSTGKEEVLFIGNSHTYFNQGVRTHLAKFRANDDLGFTPLIQEAAKGGYTLQDHLADQSTLDKIKERSWDVIILQENTFVAAEAEPATVEAMIALSDMVVSKGTKVFLFMTWPYQDQADMLTGIKETYQSGVLRTGATLVPVGLEWQLINENEEVDIKLYDPDGVHPSLEGTFYATAMFYKAIYNKLPAENTYHAGLNIEVANYLKSKVD